MVKKKTSTGLTPFINLQSDYGFKRTFGTEKFRPALIRFLKAALGDEIDIERVEPHKVEYHDKEALPAEPEGKRIVYDVYFTLKTAQGASNFKQRHLLKSKDKDEVAHHFILEMQNVYEPPFEDRMTFYASKMLAEQGIAGWNYDLDPVILIAVTDFDFKHLSPQMVQEFELRDKNTGESLTNKLRLMFYSLKQLPTKWADCETDYQKALFLIKNMDKMDRNSIPYREGEFEEFFEAAKSSNMAAEDVVLYSQSLSRLRSYQAGLDYRYEEGREEGRAEGIERGRAEGIEQGRAEGIEQGRAEGIERGRAEGIEQGRAEGIEQGRAEGMEQGRAEGMEQGIEKGISIVARKLKAEGMNINHISEVTGLSPEQISGL